MAMKVTVFSAEIEQLVTEKLLIPNYPMGQVTSESLECGCGNGSVVGEVSEKELIEL